MLDLSKLLDRIFRLHGAIPRRLRRDGRAFLPVHMFVEVTFRCNLRCNFCEYLDIIEGKAKHVGPHVGDLSYADIIRHIDALPYGRLVSFAGGETLVRRDFPEILAHASRRHRTHVVTNGSLIDEDIARQYVDLGPRRVWQNGLVLVGISMEGDEERHDRIVQRPGSWRRTVEGVRHVARLRRAARKRYPKLNLKLVVTRDTVDGLVDFVRLAHDLGVDMVNFLAEHDLVGHSGTLTGHPADNRLYAPQRRPDGVDPRFLRDQLREAFVQAESFGLQTRLTPHVPIEEFVRHYTDDRTLDPAEYECGAAWSRIGIAADGRYSPACNYVRTGDVRQGSLSEAWNGEDFRALRVAIRESRVFPGCNGCCNLQYVGRRAFGLAGLGEMRRVGASEASLPQGRLASRGAARSAAATSGGPE